MSSILKIDFCSYEAAKFACENWHYSKCTPVGKLVKFGVWENNEFIGSLIYSRGASPNLAKPYNLEQKDICELTRIALKNHKTPVSKILSITLKLLKKFCPNIKLCISFADPRENHFGIIYQASNFIYTGKQVPGGSLEYLINGKWTHPRSIGAKYGVQGKKFLDKNRDIPTRKPTLKYRYIYLFDKTIKINTMKYPKRAISKDIVASANHAEEGSETLTIALQSFKEKSESTING